MTQRMWPVHVIGLALWLGAFLYGYAQLAGERSFGPALHESLVIPLWGGSVLVPFTFLVGVVSCVLFILGREFQNRSLFVAGYFTPAAYWAWLATALADLDL